ncbi:MAG: beta-ketoacyl-ACP synthase II [Spirochaetes bacterium]|nr:beta-ketoacyl-ACP synthase II [Spirochaetota bacterium]
MKKVVITGTGAVTPLGLDVESTWNALLEGKSGISRITKFDVTELPTKIAGELKGFDALNFIDKKEARRLDPFVHYAFAAAAEAVKMASINTDAINKYGAQRCGMIVSSGIGGIDTFTTQVKAYVKGGYRKVSPFFIPSIITNMASGLLAIKYGFQGPNFSISTACATANHSIAEAINIIKHGQADLMLVGGSEAAICIMGLSGFMAQKAISVRNDDPETASRPFDSGRDGFVMGEGSGVMVIESEESAKERGVEILAEIAGAGMSCDAYHMTAPCPDGSGAARAVKNALKNADINPEKIDYVNTHGTSTPLGDKAEVQALKTVFGEHAEKLKINSTKSMTGHLLGAAAGVEGIACVKTLITNEIHPTINQFTSDPGCDLDFVPNKKIQHKVNYAISNSFGFGGHNASVVYKKYQN